MGLSKSQINAYSDKELIQVRDALRKAGTQGAEVKRIEQEIASRGQKQTTSDEDRLRDMFKKLPQYENALTLPEFAQLKNEAFGTGPIDIYEKMRAQQAEAQANEQGRLGQQLNQSLQNADQAQGGQLGNIYSTLAMGGGLSSGARERLGEEAMLGGMMQKQDIRGANERSVYDLLAKGREDLLGIGTKEADYRMQGRDKYTQALIDERKRKQDYNLNRANQGLGIEAGFAQARSQERIADSLQPKGGGSWIVTAYADSLGMAKADRLSFYRLRLYAKKHHTDDSVFYHSEFHKLADYLKSVNFDFSSISSKFGEILGLIKSKKMEAAFEEYKQLMLSLINGRTI